MLQEAKISTRGKETTMRFIVMVKATKGSEAGKMPDAKLLQDMNNFNEELQKAGVLLAGEGLKPSSTGARVRFTRDGQKSVVDGPFTETKELVAGFWLWKVNSREEAIAWAKRCPSPHPGEECEIELRQIFEMEDFIDQMTPEMREQGKRVFDKAKANR